MRLTEEAEPAQTLRPGGNMYLTIVMDVNMNARIGQGDSKVAVGALGAGLVPARHSGQLAGDHKGRPYTRFLNCPE